MANSFEPGANVPIGAISLCVPSIRGNERAYIQECLDCNQVSSFGTFVGRFEQKIAEYVGAQWAVATVNGTSALHIALRVAGVQPDDEVLVSSLTFIAPANAIRYVGAWPVFIDAEPAYWQMDPERLLQFIERDCHWVRGALYNRTTGRRVKAILPVHLLGHPCDMDPILDIAKKYNLLVIEDATESLGSRYKGRNIGRLGDVSCFSFNGNKIITAGGGGMIVTDNELWARKAKYLTTQAKDDPVEYVHYEVGYNYRLCNIQAAMGLAQLELIDENIRIKRLIAGRYSQAFHSVPGIQPMLEAPWAFSIYWMYTTLVDEEVYGLDSRSLMRSMAKAGIVTRPLWQPIHRSPAYKNLSANPFVGDVADRLNRQALSLPCSVGLTESEQGTVIDFVHSRSTLAG